MANIFKVTLTTAFFMSAAMPAAAQIIVIGTGAAYDCYQSAKFEDPGRASAIRNCENALTESNLNRNDKVATHVNAGILYMRRGHHKKAQTHYKLSLIHI